MPFKGVHYDSEKVGNIGKVAAPPYDIISAEEQELYYQRSEYNIIRLILGKVYSGDNNTNNRYTRAADLLEDWLSKGVLVQDVLPSFYIYKQVYTLDEKERTRRGIIGLVKLEEFQQGVILPHEKTFTAPKADRLALLRACRANLSPVFGLYSDPSRKLSPIFTEHEDQAAPRYQIIDDQGIHHSIWPVSHQESVRQITALLEDKQILIADGHHRYETALQFQKEMREGMAEDIGEKPFDYILMYLADMDEEGISILPTHRLIRHAPSLKGEDLPSLLKRIGQHFEIREFPFIPEINEEAIQKKALLRAMKEQGQKNHAFGFYTGGNCFYLLTFKGEALSHTLLQGNLPEVWRDLNVTILQLVLLENVLGISSEDIRNQNLEYTQDHSRAITKVRSGEYRMVFLLNPTSIERIKKVTASGQRMPEKSSYFYPKLLTGLALHKF
mgnify:CR=1 FL=1